MSAAELRKTYAEKRDALGPEARARKSQEIWERLAELPVFKKASQALFYVSFRSEVETGLMRSSARELGMTVAAPRPSAHGGRMVFYDLGSKEKLETGPFGLQQPFEDSEAVTELQDASVLLLPGLVFDVQGYRLGWGGGYYDRFLAGEGRGLPSVGLAFEIQITEELLHQAHDMPVDWIVTESRVLDCRKL